MTTQQGPYSGSERRRAPRLPCDPLKELVLHVHPDATLCESLLADISPYGLGLLVGMRVRVGAKLSMLNLHPRAAQNPLLTARVVHATPHFNGVGTLIGCEFSAPLADDEMQALLA